MSYRCATCGQVHDELPRFFMFRAPSRYANDRHSLMFDSKFTCRHPDGSYFISCELELPIRTGENLVLGFISWAEVPEESYLSYLAYRDHIDEASGFEELMDAKLANEIHGVPGSDGTPIRFRVLPHDPIPYIRWAAEDSPLGARMEEGATPEYWHSVVQRW